MSQKTHTRTDRTAADAASSPIDKPFVRDDVGHYSISGEEETAQEPVLNEDSYIDVLFDTSLVDLCKWISSSAASACC